jgi:fatty acid desaturase
VTTPAFARTDADSKKRVPDKVEWRTVALIAGLHGAFVAAVMWHDSMPWPAAMVLFALLGCLHMSILHEVLHGHPTPNQRLNEALVMLPAVSWLPYPLYRDAHRLHHRVELTVPGVDPESFYVDLETWERANPVWRGVLWVNRTVLGRVFVWPAVMITRALIEAARVAPLDRRQRRVWAGHIVSVAVSVGLVCGLGGVPWWLFLIGFGYFGLGLSNVRSFVEHLSVESGTPCAVVRANAFWGLLFLNNNLHHAHHSEPDAAWYRLPAIRRELGSDDLAAEGAGLYTGYLDVFRRYLVRPFDQPVHRGSLVSAAAAVPAAES